jgi:hypothetical protein
MRNDIAHSILPRSDLNDRINDWVQSFPSGFSDFPDNCIFRRMVFTVSSAS